MYSLKQNFLVDNFVAIKIDCRKISENYMHIVITSSEKTCEQSVKISVLHFFLSVPNVIGEQFGWRNLGRR